MASRLIGHHYCTPLLVQKDTTIPLAELEPPFYLVTWGNMANIYLEHDQGHVIEVVMKGGRSQRFEHIVDVMHAFSNFCSANHTDEVHTCISSHYRVPIHSVLERFPAKPAGVSLDVETMMFIDNGEHPVEDASQALPADLPAQPDETFNNGDHLYPTPNGSHEGTPLPSPLPSRAASPDLPIARANTPDPKVPVEERLLLENRTRSLKPIWYFIRLKNNWSFLYANRTPALALFNLFLDRGCVGEWTYGHMPDTEFPLLKKKPAASETVYYAVRGYYRYGVFLDFRFGVEILTQGTGIHHAPASMMITTDKVKAKRWARAEYARDFGDIQREELGIFSGEI